MAVLSDNIEEFIKNLMSEYEGILELQRNELAEYFRCAPSQINYVLATRFSPEKGYIIESRRGGGGFIKLIRVNESKAERIKSLVSEKLSSGKISQREANMLIDSLYASDFIDEKQGSLMLAAVSDKAINIPASIKDEVRAGILKQMVLAILKDQN
ncbi:MAG: CtsR family transcriptional regulator [Christensenellaceae bacterium]|nr:CtsR family transcriptional regulator [Christensenellaceae bacterium]